MVFTRYWEIVSRLISLHVHTTNPAQLSSPTFGFPVKEAKNRWGSRCRRAARRRAPPPARAKKTRRRFYPAPAIEQRPPLYHRRQCPQRLLARVGGSLGDYFELMSDKHLAVKVLTPNARWFNSTVCSSKIFLRMESAGTSAGGTPRILRTTRRASQI